MNTSILLPLRESCYYCLLAGSSGSDIFVHSNLAQKRFYLSVCTTFCWWQLRGNFFFSLSPCSSVFSTLISACSRLTNASPFDRFVVDSKCTTCTSGIYHWSGWNRKKKCPQRLIIVRTAEDEWPSGKWLSHNSRSRWTHSESAAGILNYTAVLKWKYKMCAIPRLAFHVWDTSERGTENRE